MGVIKNVVLDGQEELDKALKRMQEAQDKDDEGSWDEWYFWFTYYQGLYNMFKLLVPGFEVEVVDGHHELIGV